ncbi:ATP-binding protein [Candidatus Woesearchaeota archaeon]|nr:ATP-binding protein [Candidatus Woesearchaeota archaeon]
MYSKTMTVEDICKRLRPIFGKKIDHLYLKYVMTSDRQSKAEIEQALQALYQKHLTESLLNEELLLEPPKKEAIKGPYPLGTVIYGKKELYPFSLRERDWIRHVCVTGMSGSGKTTFAFQILGNFIFNKKPFLVFDWKKSFRPLIKLNDKLRIYTVGNDNVANFKLNICKPPRGVDPKEWINLLADIITESYSASFGVHKMLVQTMDQAFTDFGVYAGSGNYPTWYQVTDRLETKAQSAGRSREGEWLESSLRIAYALTFGNFGKALCYKGPEGNSIEELFDKEVVMELASLSNTEKRFFTQFVLSYIYKYAKAGNVNATEEFKYAILVDEAHNIFLKERPTFISESVADVIFREIREYGISLIALDQHVSKLSDVVSGNAATNIAFQQMLPADIEAISRLMQLQDHKAFFTKLPVGVGIVRLVERHHDPFIIKAPLVRLKAHAIDEPELRERMRSLLKQEKRKEVFAKSVREEELARKLDDLEYVFIKSGTKPDRDVLREHVAFDEARKAAQAAQDAHQQSRKDGKGGIGIRNHLQQKILEDAKKRLLDGESAQDLKQWFLAAGYNRVDVLHVFRYLERKGLDVKLLRKASAKAGAPAELSLSRDEVSFLVAARAHPELSVSALYKEASLSPRKGNEVKRSLEDGGVISIEESRSPKGWSKHVITHRSDQLDKILTTKE